MASGEARTSRVLLTVADGRGTRRDVDVLLDADVDGPLAGALPVLVAALGEHVHPSFVGHVPVWVDGSPADPVASLRRNGIAPGAVVALHGPVGPGGASGVTGPAVGGPAGGVAEVRVVAGPARAGCTGCRSVAPTPGAVPATSRCPTSCSPPTRSPSRSHRTASSPSRPAASRRSSTVSRSRHPRRGRRVPTSPSGTASSRAAQGPSPRSRSAPQTTTPVATSTGRPGCCRPPARTGSRCRSSRRSRRSAASRGSPCSPRWPSPSRWRSSSSRTSSCSPRCPR